MTSKHFHQDRPEPRVANPSAGFCYLRETNLPQEAASLTL